MSSDDRVAASQGVEGRHAAKLELARARLADIRLEQQRQMRYAGERLGVFARLKELARDERRVMKRIEQLEIANA